MLDDDDHPMAGKQLMVLWSTKENDVVHINDVEWKPKGTPGFDEQGAIQVDGMVCAWWFDGSVMHDEIIAKVCDMIVLPPVIHHGRGKRGKVVEQSSHSRTKIVRWECCRTAHNFG